MGGLTRGKGQMVDCLGTSGSRNNKTFALASFRNYDTLNKCQAAVVRTHVSSVSIYLLRPLFAPPPKKNNILGVFRSGHGSSRWPGTGPYLLMMPVSSNRTSTWAPVSLSFRHDKIPEVFPVSLRCSKGQDARDGTSGERRSKTATSSQPARASQGDVARASLPGFALFLGGMDSRHRSATRSRENHFQGIKVTAAQLQLPSCSRAQHGAQVPVLLRSSGWGWQNTQHKEATASPHLRRRSSHLLSAARCRSSNNGCLIECRPVSPTCKVYSCWMTATTPYEGH